MSESENRNFEPLFWKWHSKPKKKIMRKDANFNYHIVANHPIGTVFKQISANRFTRKHGNNFMALRERKLLS